MGKQVPKTNTPVSDAQMAQAIINVWQRLFGTVPSREQVYMVMAQNAIETGGKRESMHNYNVGNIITGGADHDYFLGGDWMYTDKSETQKKNITQKFRAYNTLEEGVEDYLKVLSKMKRYSEAWQHIMHPDVRAYSKALHDAGYYGAKEEVYTKGLLAQYNRFNKGDSYSAGLSGKENPPSSMVAKQDSTSPMSGLDNFLQQFLDKMKISATDHNLKKLYKHALQNNDILIQIEASDHTNAVEFSRILCAALDEDLLSTSYPHTDGHLVEVECSIPGPPAECFAAVKQMTEAIIETFKDATSKIGGVKVKSNVIMDKKSSYQPISPKTADTNYRKFLLKFV
jgi:hypothetical protein